jgi:hypothetical protein
MCKVHVIIQFRIVLKILRFSASHINLSLKLSADLHNFVMFSFFGSKYILISCTMICFLLYNNLHQNLRMKSYK